MQYDGYETFSAPPPSVQASFGASGSMDPPQPDDDEDINVVGGMVARLGLEGAQNVDSMALITQLGLGEGTRVVDMQVSLIFTRLRNSATFSTRRRDALRLISRTTFRPA